MRSFSKTATITRSSAGEQRDPLLEVGGGGEVHEVDLDAGATPLFHEGHQPDGVESLVDEAHRGVEFVDVDVQDPGGVGEDGSAIEHGVLLVSMCAGAVPW